MMTLSYRKQIELAHEMGAKYEMGYWRFPSMALKAQFERRVAGMEWTPEMQANADEALRKLREAAKPAQPPIEPGD